MPTYLKQVVQESYEEKKFLPSVRWYFTFFIVSGFCGLVYEVVWLRLAMASFGVTAALVSIVLSMFMAGLGLGSWLGGVLIQRRADGPLPIRLYALAELLVGCSSVLVPYQLKLGRLLLQHLGSLGAWQSSTYYLIAGLWIGATLTPWCACMGCTFPLLMSMIRQTSQPLSERSFSYLYVANVFGALVGTLMSAFVLIELLGFKGTLYVAGVLNALLAIAALTISRRFGPHLPALVPKAQPAPRQRLYGMHSRAVLWFLFTTGLVSMGMEVIWIRQLTPYLGNVVYAFAGILAVYLLATVVGSHDYRAWVHSHNLSQSASAWSLLALFAIIPVIAVDPLVPLQLGGADLGGVRLASIVLFCAMAGFLTPLLVDSWSGGDPAQAGTAYALNVVGSILGPLIAGFWLLPWLGERRAAFALALPLFLIAALTAFCVTPNEAGQPPLYSNPKLRFALATAVAVLLFSISHDYANRYPVREVRRDYTATVVATGKGFDRELLVNGVGMTSLTPVTKYMAHLPLAIRSRPPQNGLVICFGMGTSFRSMLSWQIPTTAVDLVPSVPAMFGFFHSDAQTVARSPLARIVIDDGRRFLDGSSDSYDVIVVDPPPPPAAPGSSLLYSREFYEVVKSHLRKDGILQVWYPAAGSDATTLASVTRSLKESFPYLKAFLSFDGLGIYFLASMEPLSIPSSSILASRLPSSAASDFVEWGPESNTEMQFDRVVSQEVTIDQLLAAAPRAPVLRDNEPINEYYLLRSWFHRYR